MTKRSGKLWLAAWMTCVLAACGGGNSTPKPPPPPPPPAVDTLNFANVDFSEVEIRNSFAFIVQYGDRFDVEVEIDREYSDLVSVTQEGVRLTIEFDPTFNGDIRAQVARGVVTVPALDVLDVNGSAFVDLAGFTQSFLQTQQSGSSHIAGANNQIDFVDAVLSGFSHLDLQLGSPVPAANVVLSGSSQATFSIMDGGTLTGSASGTSNVSYYGSGIGIAVQTFNSASVTWLGDNTG